MFSTIINRAHLAAAHLFQIRLILDHIIDQTPSLRI